MAQILIADDEPKLGKLLVEALTTAGHQVTHVPGGAAALDQLTVHPPDIVLTDLRMPGIDGMKVLEEAKKRSPSTDVVIMTAHATAANAVEAMKLGAIDYLIKPFAMDELRLRIARIADRRTLATRATALASKIDRSEGFGRVIAESPKMKSVLEQAQRVAGTDETVLLLGESGTGKSLLARAIHNASKRATGPFVELHAAALPDTLVEGELFGREKGAYTGANETKAGHAEAAQGGTLFLDEIGELPPATQVKLLRLLQDRTFTRLGSTQQRKADVRIVAATNRDLDAAVKAGAFREDLYYRLNTIVLRVPPLAERADEILPLATHFLSAGKRFAPDAREALRRHAWPGNVRELRNAIARAELLATGDELTAVDLALPGPAPAADVELDRGTIEAALARAGGVIAQAAAELGLSRQALYRRMEKLAIPRE
jgi:DNA-binding NtrC family response regulator